MVARLVVEQCFECGGGAPRRRLTSFCHTSQSTGNSGKHAVIDECRRILLRRSPPHASPKRHVTIGVDAGKIREFSKVQNTAWVGSVRGGRCADLRNHGGGAGAERKRGDARLTARIGVEDDSAAAVHERWP